MRELKVHNIDLKTGFFLFWIFSLVGSNLYFVNTAFSLGNLLSPIILFIPLALRKVRLSKNELVFFMPILLNYLLGVFTFFYAGNYQVELSKDLYYFSIIPFLFISILLLGKHYGISFYKEANRTVYSLLVLLFIIMVFELLTGIHLPSHSKEPTLNLTPTAFFTNPNDFSIITLSLYLFFVVSNRSFFSKKRLIIASVITAIIILSTLSRIGLVVYTLVIIHISLNKKIAQRLFVLLGLLLGLFIIINTIKVPSSSTNLIGRNIVRIQSIFNPNQQISNKNSSIQVRADIYKIPFVNQGDFWMGHSFQSEAVIINQYKTKNYKIINSHSFFIETIFALGWPSFMLYLIFFILILSYAITNKYPLLVILTISYLLLLNVSSGYIRNPIFWIPLFISLSYYQNKETINRIH